MFHLNTLNPKSMLKPTFTPKGKYIIYKLHVVIKSMIYLKGFQLFNFSTSNLFLIHLHRLFIKVNNVKSKDPYLLAFKGLLKSCVVPITIMHLAKVENNLVSKAMFIVQKCKVKGV